jgi:hypothetical protein
MKEEKTKIAGVAFEELTVENFELFNVLATLISERFHESDQHNGLYIMIKPLSDKKILFSCRMLANIPSDYRREYRVIELREICEEALKTKTKQFIEQYKDYVGSKLFSEKLKDAVPKTIKFKRNEKNQNNWETVEFLGSHTYLGTQGGCYTLHQIFNIS